MVEDPHSKRYLTNIQIYPPSRYNMARYVAEQLVQGGRELSNLSGLSFNFPSIAHPGSIAQTHEFSDKNEI